MEVIKKILRLENMLSICLFFETSELKYAYKLYAYKKECTHQLLSNLRNENLTYFLQWDAFPRKPTEDSNENIGFAIDMPPQCLTNYLIKFYKLQWRTSFID